MVNSIREKLSESDTISEIRLLLGVDKARVCLVVEGEDDQKLFAPLFAKNVDIIQSYNSRDGVVNIVHKHFPNNKRVIGIRDKDYERKVKDARVFYCDFCCAEMMIISIDICFERLYSNFYKGSFNSQDLRLYCLSHLEKLSKYRKLNERNGWKIKFDGIKPGKLFDDIIMQMDDNILMEINKQNPYNQITKTREKSCVVLSRCSSLDDYLHITNGHDFVNLFCAICLKTSNQTSVKAIEVALRSAFNKEEFKQTQLYNALLLYQNKCNINVM